MPIRNKNILLAVTGSISAYKACDLIGLLKSKGANVRVIVTPSAARLVSTTALAVLSEHRVYGDIFEDNTSPSISHIQLAQWADVFFLAPCTANTLGELAHGLTRSLVSLVYLSFSGPVVIAPAMNTSMLNHHAVKSNLQILVNCGCFVLPTGWGMLACGRQGYGKLLPPEILTEYLQSVLSHYNIAGNSALPLQGVRCLVVLGHTQEKVDDIRYFANRSSGKTGFCIARALKLSGANVNLLCGCVDEVLSPEYVTGVDLFLQNTTTDICQVLKEKSGSYQIIVMSAALADFIPKKQVSGKIKSSRNLESIPLIPAPNALAQVIKSRKSGQIIVGFALENQGCETEGLKKALNNGVDYLVLNTPVIKGTPSSFGKDNVAGSVYSKKEIQSTLKKAKSTIKLPKVDKYHLASSLIQKLKI